MESWDFDNVKAEKASAIRKYNRLRSIAKVFRFGEFCFALVFLSWTFARLPFALTLSCDYLRLLAGVVSSPLFVFLLCNVIIASLVLKSRHVTAVDHNPNYAFEAKLYDGFIQNSGGDHRIKSESEIAVVSEIVYQDKQIVSEVNSADPKGDTESNSDSGTDSEFPKVYRRTRSENFEREREPAKLQRSETEILKNVKSGEECEPDNLGWEDDLSNEEFQRAIEAFIEKQLKFRHQESLAIVLQN